MNNSKEQHLLLEAEERRKNREPILHVWDWLVRIGHWLLVLCFLTAYVRYRKFPIHTYAGYIMFLVLLVRIVWGFVGSRAARFKNFLYSPRTLFAYTKGALHGHADYYVSHNPMGAYMVFLLMALMLVNCFLGLLLYSATEQLGPFGAAVPDTWDTTLKFAHHTLANIAAACVLAHIFGVLWAARLHRENYAVAMLTGCKRVPRNAQNPVIDGYPEYPESRIPKFMLPIERWFNFRHPFVGSIIATAIICLVVYGLMNFLVRFNSQLYYY
jgi:cytochrome b